jgi:putative colanic acid biosynthesis acetyltransferase WcaF
MLAGKPLFRVSFHNAYRFRAWLLRLFGAKVGRDTRIRPTVNVEIPWNLDIRDGVTVGDYAILYSLGTITIGERTIVSQYAHLCAGTHDHTDRRFPLIRDPIEVGADAWIGADAFVGPNVRIGRLSVLGARSSAYKDLDPAAVYVGNPARRLKTRELH